MVLRHLWLSLAYIVCACAIATASHGTFNPPGTSPPVPPQASPGAGPEYYCADGCYLPWVGDDECHVQCNNAACGFDGNDCTLSLSQSFSSNTPGPFAHNGDDLGASIAMEIDMLATGAPGDHGCGNTSIVNLNINPNVGMPAFSCPRTGAVHIFYPDGMIYWKAPNADSGDSFGLSLASANWTDDSGLSCKIVAGAPGQASCAAGIGAPANASDNACPDAGAVYVTDLYAFDNQTIIKAPQGGGSRRFGHSLALRNQTMVIGAPGDASCSTIAVATNAYNDTGCPAAGAAYVYVADPEWRLQAVLKAPNARANYEFGVSVAVSDRMIVVGSSAEASCSNQSAPSAASDTECPHAGAAYVFVQQPNGSWSFELYLKSPNSDAGDLFGDQLSLEDDLVVIGAKNESSCNTYIDLDTPTESTGAMHLADNDCPSAGAAYAFRIHNGTSWDFVAYIKPPVIHAGQEFGRSLRYTSHGLVVAAKDDSCQGGTHTQVLNDTDCASRGSFASGDYGSGDYGSGDYGSGDYGSGDFASGDYGSGDYGSGDYGSGNNSSPSAATCCAESGAIYVLTPHTFTLGYYMVPSQPDAGVPYSRDTGAYFSRSVFAGFAESGAESGPGIYVAVGIHAVYSAGLTSPLRWGRLLASPLPSLAPGSSCALPPDSSGHVTIPPNWQHIDAGAFEGCDSLRSISIPSSVGEIGPAAFRGTSLTAVTLPDTVLAVRAGAFERCRSLTSIWLGSSVEYVGARAFYECSALVEYNVPLSLTRMETEAIKGTALSSVCVEGLGTHRFLGSLPSPSAPPPSMPPPEVPSSYTQGGNNGVKTQGS